MTLRFNENFLKKYISPEALSEQMKQEVLAAQAKVLDGTGAGKEFLGWRDLPVDYDREEFARIKAAAARIREMCDVLIVIGIGGSYLGARAAIEFCTSPLYNSLPGKTPAIYFTGNTMSASAMSDLLAICKDKDLCVNVVSKSGTTTEPAIAFRIFREVLEKKYGPDGAKSRIFATTDKQKGVLKELSDAKGYETFVVPDDVGGRYSVLTAVGLLPIACAGIDIDKMMSGAADARVRFIEKDFETNDCLRYAAVRNYFYRNDKSIELLAAYDPSLTQFCEWWKQLFGESEGKDHKGIYPASAIFSTDLHSLGQYIQDGSRILFETVIDIKSAPDSVTIPTDEKDEDKMNFVACMDMNEVNRNAMLATLVAHTDGGVPNGVVELADRSAYTFGYAVYFFEFACAVSGYTLGVNPFNQPGVEAYKNNMFALLGKPGHAEAGEALRKRIEEING